MSAAVELSTAAGDMVSDTPSQLKELVAIVYLLPAPSPPRRQDRQMPNPLPLAMLKLQRVSRRVSSLGLKVATVNGVSVMASVPPGAGPLVEWSFVPKASIPLASVIAPFAPACYVAPECTDARD